MKKIFIFMFGTMLALTACTKSHQQNNYNIDQNRDPLAYDESTSQYLEADNDYSNIDSFRPKTEKQKEESAKHWNTSRKETHWQEYKGTMVRVEILLGDTDTREMRLKLMQNADGMDVDGDSRHILSKVANYEMKKVCGRNAENIMIIYDNPSLEVMRPTSYFDYRVESEGTTMREYGFKCGYKTK